jgi:uncharacterized protein (TIGR03067 family)
MQLRIALVPLVVLLIAADAKEDAIKKDKAALKGNWQVTALEDSDEKVPEEQTRKMSITISETMIVSKQGGAGEKSKGEYAIDPTKTPKEIDIKLMDGAEKGKTIKGIYKLDGDTLVICTSEPGDARPKEFKATKQPQSILLTFKRIKE